MLLQPLEGVKQSAKYHPEGDALCQPPGLRTARTSGLTTRSSSSPRCCTTWVRRSTRPTTSAGLQALEGSITERTERLIAHHMEAHAYREGTLGARARVRLQQLEEFDDLLLLRELDRRGRVPGAQVCEVAEALDYLRKLDEELSED
ncbi:MAG: hypothetical protein U0835_16955 [Isosphaeraceae bacterium]